MLIGLMAYAVLAGADPAPLGRYAAALGLAFQIADDILDVEGDAGKAGSAGGGSGGTGLTGGDGGRGGDGGAGSWIIGRDGGGGIGGDGGSGGSGGTGGTGIGYGVAQGLADAGANVVISARRADEVAAAAEQISARGAGRATWCRNAGCAR